MVVVTRLRHHVAPSPGAEQEVLPGILTRTEGRRYLGLEALAKARLALVPDQDE